ncbi:hypothetical protein LAZ67_16001021 [Cordylochernes scorpioides]|uniref:Uncharacterized protein n=1 Tax=Cordylochernes scorpioides TaxID=51811 RepID=A0ABY6LEK6_9ARAC|nr:hypothetical protein LAZ67_16001021 [Cordylochernes scorpioides]
MKTSKETVKLKNFKEIQNSTGEYDEQAVMKELESNANYAKMYSDIQIRISKILEAKAEEKKAISEAGSEGSRRANLMKIEI